jgi:hypothetical protein
MGKLDGDYDGLSREIHDSRCAMHSRGEALMEV